jgi:ATP-dependent DNA ligase
VEPASDLLAFVLAAGIFLGGHDPDGRLVYAGRAGTGIKRAELERLWRRLQPLAIDSMPLAVPPPRDSRFGSPLVLSRVHWGLVVIFVPKVPI